MNHSDVWITSCITSRVSQRNSMRKKWQKFLSDLTWWLARRGLDFERCRAGVDEWKPSNLHFLVGLHASLLFSLSLLPRVTSWGWRGEAKLAQIILGKKNERISPFVVKIYERKYKIFSRRGLDIIFSTRCVYFISLLTKKWNDLHYLPQI